MEDLTEQEALRIIDAYGEPFLRYVLALPDDKPIAEALLSINIELMLILSSAIDPSSYASGGTIDPTFLASLNFSSYRADLGSSLANSLRLLAGGNLPIVPDGEDPVVQAIREITSDIWPSLLLKHPKHTPRAFWLGASTSVFLHPRSLDACKAFMADDRLASLFPDTPSIDTASEISDVMQIQANWIINTGVGGSRQLLSVMEAIIQNAAILVHLEGYSLNHTNIMMAIPRSVDFFRNLSTRKPVRVLSLIGFSGLLLDESQELEFGGDRIRAIRPIEKDLVLTEAGLVTSVLQTQFEVQLLDVSSTNENGSSEYFSRMWSKYSARMQEAHRSLQCRVDRVRLSILLASEGSEYLATREVTRYIADPTQPGGVSRWQSDQMRPTSYPLKNSQIEEISRLYGIIQEKHPESLDIAMKRILSAVSQRWDATDAFIDAVVVWENAFGTTTETTFRVTASIAKLLEPGSAEERAKLQKELKRLYEERSRLVHGAKEPKPEDAWDQRDRAINIAVDVLRKLYTERPDLLGFTSDLRGSQLLLEG